MKHSNFNLYFTKGGRGCKPRAAIRISRRLNSVELTEFCNQDRSSCLVKCRGFNLIVVSQYCDIKKPAVPEGLVEIVERCRDKNTPLIIGADSNAHSTLWGPDNNPRGLDMEGFIAQHNLHVLNDGIKHTWEQGKKKSWIDITIINQAALNKGLGQEWEVSSEKLSQIIKC